MTEGIYGSIIFGKALGRIHTFYEVKRNYKGRYGEHCVHLRKPLLEWGGSELVEITMSLVLNAAWCGDPTPILAEWHLYHQNALAAPLIIGGKPMGPGLSLFVLTELYEHQRQWLPGGQLIALELAATFKEYIPFADDSLASPLGSLGIPGFS